MQQLGVIFGTFRRQGNIVVYCSSHLFRLVLLSREVLIKTMRHILVSQRKSHTTQPQQHLSPISHTLALTYTPFIPLNVTGSAERSNKAKGWEALGSILHHFSQLGHYLSPLKLLYICEWSYLHSWQVSRWVKALKGGEDRARSRWRVRRKENEREMKVGGVWARSRSKGRKKWARSFKIHRGDEIWWCLTLSYYKWKWIQDSALSQMVNMPCSLDA